MPQLGAPLFDGTMGRYDNPSDDAHNLRQLREVSEREKQMSAAAASALGLQTRSATEAAEGAWDPQRAYEHAELMRRKRMVPAARKKAAAAAAAKSAAAVARSVEHERAAPGSMSSHSPSSKDLRMTRHIDQSFNDKQRARQRQWRAQRQHRVLAEQKAARARGYTSYEDIYLKRALASSAYAALAAAQEARVVIAAGAIKVHQEALAKRGRRWRLQHKKAVSRQLRPTRTVDQQIHRQDPAAALARAKGKFESLAASNATEGDEPPSATNLKLGEADLVTLATWIWADPEHAFRPGGKAVEAADLRRMIVRLEDELDKSPEGALDFSAFRDWFHSEVQSKRGIGGGGGGDGRTIEGEGGEIEGDEDEREAALRKRVKRETRDRLRAEARLQLVGGKEERTKQLSEANADWRRRVHEAILYASTHVDVRFHELRSLEHRGRSGRKNSRGGLSWRPLVGMSHALWREATQHCGGYELTRAAKQSMRESLIHRCTSVADLCLDLEQFEDWFDEMCSLLKRTPSMWEEVETSCDGDGDGDGNANASGGAAAIEASCGGSNSPVALPPLPKGLSRHLKRHAANAGLPGATVDAFYEDHARQHATQLFAKFDADSNGRIDRHEAQQLAEWVWDSFHPGGIKANDAERKGIAKKLVKRLDKNNDGKITLEEFLDFFADMCDAIRNFRLKRARGKNLSSSSTKNHAKNVLTRARLAKHHVRRPSRGARRKFRSPYEDHTRANDGSGNFNGVDAAPLVLAEFRSMPVVQLLAKEIGHFPIDFIFERIQDCCCHGDGRSVNRRDYTECMLGMVQRSALTKEVAADMRRLVSTLYDCFDIDGDGRVSLAELCSGVSVICGGDPEMKIKSAFKLYDFDGDGVVTLKEMARYLTAVFTVVEKLEPEEVRAQNLHFGEPKELAWKTACHAFDMFDTDRGGSLSFGEFVAWSRGGGRDPSSPRHRLRGHHVTRLRLGSPSKRRPRAQRKFNSPYDEPQRAKLIGKGHECVHVRSPSPPNHRRPTRPAKFHPPGSITAATATAAAAAAALPPLHSGSGSGFDSPPLYVTTPPTSPGSPRSIALQNAAVDTPLRLGGFEESPEAMSARKLLRVEQEARDLRERLAETEEALRQERQKKQKTPKKGQRQHSSHSLREEVARLVDEGLRRMRQEHEELKAQHAEEMAEKEHEMALREERLVDEYSAKFERVMSDVEAMMSETKPKSEKVAAALAGEAAWAEEKEQLELQLGAARNEARTHLLDSATKLERLHAQHEQLHKERAARHEEEKREMQIAYEEELRKHRAEFQGKPNASGRNSPPQLPEAAPGSYRDQHERFGQVYKHAHLIGKPARRGHSSPSISRKARRRRWSIGSDSGSGKNSDTPSRKKYTHAHLLSRARHPVGSPRSKPAGKRWILDGDAGLCSANLVSSPAMRKVRKAARSDSFMSTDSAASTGPFFSIAPESIKASSKKKRSDSLGPFARIAPAPSMKKKEIGRSDSLGPFEMIAPAPLKQGTERSDSVGPFEMIAPAPYQHSHLTGRARHESPRRRPSRKEFHKPGSGTSVSVDNDFIPPISGYVGGRQHSTGGCKHVEGGGEKRRGSGVARSAKELRESTTSKLLDDDSDSDSSSVSSVSSVSSNDVDTPTSRPNIARIRAKAHKHRHRNGSGSSNGSKHSNGNNTGNGVASSPKVLLEDRHQKMYARVKEKVNRFRAANRRRRGGKGIR